MEITIAKPDDWHLHLRDGEMLETVLPFSSEHFGRAIVMPNLVPPLIRSSDIRQYRERILAALPKAHTFEPLMTAYLSDKRQSMSIAYLTRSIPCMDARARA